MYEGRSTCWLFENILTHPDSRLWCIDPFTPFDGLEGGALPRWLGNIRLYRSRILLSTCESRIALRGGRDEYHFVIVDGAHDAKSVLFDAVMGWELLAPGGVMIFDDYLWQGQGHESCTEQDKPRLALDAFVAIYQPEILHQEYQLIVRK